MTEEDYMRAPAPKTKRILVIEDLDDERDLLRLVLGEYDVAVAGDYDEGLRMAKKQYFDLYALGGRMPGGTGIDLCLRIREFDPNTPVLLYSGQAPSGYSSEAISAGAQAYFAKPIHVQEVVGTVTRLLFASSQRLSDARHAEFAAIREELAVRYGENSRSMAIAADRKQRAVRKILRLKAKNAFLNAGGARGDFLRLWPATYLDAALDLECAKRDRSD
jgi:DNA-binding response OmpR family regulator